jgi:hypothetical protein
MKKFVIGLVIAGVATLLAGPAPARATEITVHKSPWCGCCKGWVKHLEDNGFTVTALDHEDMDPIKSELGVPHRLQSCHTAMVDGYVIEGHVPADDIKRLLTEGPEAVGLAAPGMPAGSPGMEGGGTRDDYQVILFDKENASVWAEH